MNHDTCQAKMRLSACSWYMRPAGVLAGSMEMQTRQIQIKVKTWIRPRRSQVRISCSRINTCSTGHIWFQFKESKDKLQFISCSRKRTHQLRDKSSQDVTKNHKIIGERTRVFYVWCYSQSHNKLQKLSREMIVLMMTTHSSLTWIKVEHMLIQLSWMAIDG